MPVPSPITNYVQQGVALLTSQFQGDNAPQLQALLGVYLAQAQELEDAIQDTITYRQLANLRVYSPLPGTFSVQNSIGFCISSVDISEYIFPGGMLTFASQPSTPYTVDFIVAGRAVVFTTVYTGTTNTATTATQPLTNANMDVVGNLIGQLRLGQNDLNYLSVISLRIAVNRSDGTNVNWSDFAAILLRTSGGPVFYYESGTGGSGDSAEFIFAVYDMTLNPTIIGQTLALAVPNGVGQNCFAYSVWPTGGDFVFTSIYDGSSGQLGWGSIYDGSVGGLALAAVPM